MNAAPDTSVKTRLETLIALARLLEKADAQPLAIGPDQYRALVRRLAELMAGELPAEPLRQILRHFPAAAQVYENQRYAHAGLVLAPLDAAIAAEQEAARAVARWRKAA